jgi:hypothetical protein
MSTKKHEKKESKKYEKSEKKAKMNYKGKKC